MKQGDDRMMKNTKGKQRIKRKHQIRDHSLCLWLALLLFVAGSAAGCSSGPPDAAEVSAPAGAVDGDGSPSGSGPAVLDADETLTVSYIDVGQGDSAFVRLPDGKTLLIDGGEAEYGQTVIDCLEAAGAERIDYLVATHPHSDHIGGLPAVIGRFEIGAVFMPKAQSNTKIFEKLLVSIQDRGVKINTARSGVRLFPDASFSGGMLRAEFVAPCGDSYSDLNNYSAVLRLAYGDTAFLFTGDAESISEKEMLSAHSSEELRSNVLKVGHHGSGYSSTETFLKAVSPQYAVISCGAGNKYGHPESSALDRLSDTGAAVLRTDQLGTILMSSDGKTVTVDKKSAPQQENAPPASAEGADPSHGGADVPPSSGASAHSDMTVYVTGSGGKYHRDGCQYLSKSKIAISLDEARAGYEPCSKCDPPR